MRAEGIVFLKININFVW